MIKKCFLVLCLILSASSCSYVTKPVPQGLQSNLIDGAPEGTPGFRYGWKEGCESGMAAYGSLHYKMAYDFKYDRTALHNDEYHKAWEMGFRHCRWYTQSWVS